MIEARPLSLVLHAAVSAPCQSGLWLLRGCGGVGGFRQGLREALSNRLDRIVKRKRGELQPNIILPVFIRMNIRSSSQVDNWWVGKYS